MQDRAHVFGSMASHCDGAAVVKLSQVVSSLTAALVEPLDKTD